ncbi:MAG: primosomal protein N' [Chloroflexi bacterium GWB2_49_20]|nr:MAG: primosomal protein N' [Chloroflexi bacterium GWB2_49_20]OGN80550.1 MAG: primosomal protein N' [Chloroflexi bacterium GWC2_49_37]OGN83385.1 MAG: primosomal protein N' [Chloroflexi bacterium GWD2_49_16]HCC78122.1 primosomal protein N' [Anaerolineae bacterium]
MPFFAEIVVNIPSVSGVFHYSIPPDLEGHLGLGHLVHVPFGRQVVQGVVLALATASPVQETKSILDLIDPSPVITPAQIELAKNLSQATHNSLAAIISMMLPPGLAKQADMLYSIANNPDPTGWSDTQKRLYNLLKKRGSLRGRQIDRAFPNRDWRKPAQALLRSGSLISQSVLPPPGVRPKFIRVAQLAVTPEQAFAAMPDLGNTANTQKRRQVALQFLLREPEPVNVTWVYAESGCNLGDLQELAERELIVLFETEIWRDPLAHITQNLTNPPQLTSDQQNAWNTIEDGFSRLTSGESVLPFLLHGVTGSGKTEIYLRAVSETLRRGKQAIVMVPEIALTPQTVRRFLARFPGQVGLVHSRLSEGERYDTWRRARLGQLKVIIGPRSALFSPLPRIGLIILDECHDSSYYQNEPPFYDAVQAAMDSAALNGAICILGSATPPVALKYQAVSSMPAAVTGSQKYGQHQLQLLALPSRITPLDSGGVSEGTALPPVQIIDMRSELKSGNRGVFSNALEHALTTVLARDEQAILFLNRRGTATYVFCRDCGTALNCPRCENPLTFHTQLPGVELLCHRCGYTRKLPKTCPTCKSSAIRQYGLGSERVAAEVQERFPQARTLRWDWETTREKDAHEIILSHFVSQRSNVLVGTQMLAKGLDLPKVTLVGIVLADVGLNLPDPFAAERSFQVLTQVAGRAGRSTLGGQVILQTFQPEHYAIQAAAGHDYAGFYARELSERQKLGYPPFGRLVRLEFRHLDSQVAESTTKTMADYLQTRVNKTGRVETDVLGPVPCFFAKMNNLYRWQVILRGPDPASLLPTRFLEGWRVEIDPPGLL